MLAISVIKRKFKTLLSLIRYRLFSFHMINLLSKIGIRIKVFYWVQEKFDENVSVKLNDDPQEYFFELLDARDTKHILAARGLEDPEEFIKKRVNVGAKCLVAKHKDEVAAFTWWNLIGVAVLFMMFRCKRMKHIFLICTHFKSFVERAWRLIFVLSVISI